jgi:hypothetical protein
VTLVNRVRLLRTADLYSSSSEMSPESMTATMSQLLHKVDWRQSRSGPRRRGASLCTTEPLDRSMAVTYGVRMTAQRVMAAPSAALRTDVNAVKQTTSSGRCDVIRAGATPWSWLEMMYSGQKGRIVVEPHVPSVMNYEACAPKQLVEGNNFSV